MIEINTQYGTEMTTKEVRLTIYMNLLENTNTCTIDRVDHDKYILAAVAMGMKPIVMEGIAAESRKDKTITDTMLIMDGVAPEGRISQETKDRLEVGNDLHKMDDVLFFRGRPVVPTSMRDRVLANLHTAHQGTSRMISSSED